MDDFPSFAVPKTPSTTWFREKSCVATNSTFFFEVSEDSIGEEAHWRETSFNFGTSTGVVYLWVDNEDTFLGAKVCPDLVLRKLFGK